MAEVESGGEARAKAIEVVDLSFSYPDGKQALRGVSLAVSPGERVGLTGPNGAGKSTLLLHLNGILRGEGTVNILGREVNGGNLKWVRSKVGLVFQEPDDQLFSLTVFDDVAFGPINLGLPEEEVRHRVAQALAGVGMEGYEPRSPHHLSVGEKKRIAIATVLAMSPEVLALDEPTSNLDPRSKWRLIELLAALPITQVIATHDLELLEALCPRTLILDGGEIKADGPTEGILADRPLLRAHGLARDHR